MLDQLSLKVKRVQSPARYRHSINVMDLAGRLGEKYGWDPKRARLAGLLHDWAKEWEPSRLIHYVKKHHLKIPYFDFIVRTSPNLLHAYVSADAVRRAGWIKNKKDLKAMASHTLGAVPMGVEDKILYVADLASIDRRFKEAEAIRALAFLDLHRGFMAALSLKLMYQLRKNKPLHPLAVKVWNKQTRHD